MNDNTQLAANTILLGVTLLCGALAAFWAFAGNPVLGVVMAINSTMFAAQIK